MSNRARQEFARGGREIAVGISRRAVACAGSTDRANTAPGAAAVRRKSTKFLLERPRTVSEAAEELGLSVLHGPRVDREPTTRPLRLGRAIRVPAEEIRRVIEQSTIPAERK